MDYFNVDTFIASSINRLKRKRCILFLGPRFGETDAGQTASETVRKRLADEQPDLLKNLDDEFDNLFILKDANPGQEYLLKGMLANYYSEMKPGEIYTTIAKLPFRAVICCTPDLMLKKAYDNLGMKVDFHHYSHKGQEEAEMKLEDDVRVVYNLFGTAENEETLIVTYEAFFRFVVNLLSSGDRLPGALHNIFQDAEIFMLLGFDLNKWYVPLIVRKLNERQGIVASPRTSVLTLDTTFRPEAEQRLSTTFIVVENQTDVVLRRLSEAMSDQAPLAGAAREKVAPEVLSKVLDGVFSWVENNEMIKAFQLLMSHAEDFNLDKPMRTSLWAMQRNVLAASQAFASHQITFPELTGTLTGISKELYTVVEVLRSQMPKSANP